MESQSTARSTMLGLASLCCTPLGVHRSESTTKCKGLTMPSAFIFNPGVPDKNMQK